jgi:hypothetical protein
MLAGSALGRTAADHVGSEVDRDAPRTEAVT